jgi:2-keto-3-deoxy-L-rhamnonate aldolase RhmA
MLNKLKKKLADGEVAYGSWFSIFHEGAAEALAGSGLDWILIDTEHRAANPETVAKLVEKIGNKGATSLIRVAWNNIWLIKQALDTGAYGIVVPWVRSAEEAAKAVEYTRYMPEGLRGSMPMVAAKVWGVTPGEYLAKANDNVFVCIQIENWEAVEDIDKICAIPGVDAVMIGPGDLSASLGVRGETWHPKVMEAIDKVLVACKKTSVAPGIAFGKDLEHTKKLAADGFTFIGAGADGGFMVQGVKNTLDALKK